MKWRHTVWTNYTLCLPARALSSDSCFFPPLCPKLKCVPECLMYGCSESEGIRSIEEHWGIQAKASCRFPNYLWGNELQCRAAKPPYTTIKAILLGSSFTFLSSSWKLVKSLLLCIFCLFIAFSSLCRLSYLVPTTKKFLDTRAFAWKCEVVVTV